MHEDRGVVAKFLVQTGTLRVGDTVVCGAGYGRVKAMYDTLNGRLKHEEAGPSTPVNVTGLSVPRCRRPLLRPGGHRPGADLAEHRAADSRQQNSAAAPANTSPWKTCSSGSASKTTCRR